VRKAATQAKVPNFQPGGRHKPAGYRTLVSVSGLRTFCFLVPVAHANDRVSVALG